MNADGTHAHSLPEHAISYRGRGVQLRRRYELWRPRQGPAAAQAGFVQYALHFQARESTPKYSAAATVRGGKAYTNSSEMRTYIQTVSGGVLLASAYGGDGSTVNLSHQPYNGAQSRCYWDYVGGTVAGALRLDLNCWRLQ